MFVARRELKHVPLGSQKPIVIKPGQTITDFDQWSFLARKHHLSLKWVVELEEEESPPSPQLEAPQKSEPATDKVKCGVCNKDFKSARAAKIHATLAHK